MNKEVNEFGGRRELAFARLHAVENLAELGFGLFRYLVAWIQRIKKQLEALEEFFHLDCLADERCEGVA